eukprot:4808947-Prymnesium_polylepis.2
MPRLDSSRSGGELRRPEASCFRDPAGKERAVVCLCCCSCDGCARCPTRALLSVCLPRLRSFTVRVFKGPNHASASMGEPTIGACA